ncbi:hypothetical protein [Laribacter hongkongensis]|uniref:hypothetical protein n=2 Tax=Laribacter hongkongensis TaxID=168471 RepID=UPI0011C8F1BC|nr:hypothetical protein [Laribacter hongkongensis]MCG8994101.1 hypothetical protein [Laribacter hongkongensis]MCG9040547.1 hypothetical protein [Laribacter hongkongensis]MCG9054163.1 hypothetical protein [Laribacter hongkongensis]MCG9058701.1 hypothetical protein [Laribacter hongkongensis]MCG9067171.1 hypothetical protein [Laribacter hongkongensis]
MFPSIYLTVSFLAWPFSSLCIWCIFYSGHGNSKKSYIKSAAYGVIPILLFLIVIQMKLNAIESSLPPVSEMENQEQYDQPDKENKLTHEVNVVNDQKITTGSCIELDTEGNATPWAKKSSCFHEFSELIRGKIDDPEQTTAELISLAVKSPSSHGVLSTSSIHLSVKAPGVFTITEKNR